MDTPRTLTRMAVLLTPFLIGAGSQAWEAQGTPSATGPANATNTPPSTRPSATTSMPAATQAEEIEVGTARDALRKFIENSKDADLTPYLAGLAQEPRKGPTRAGGKETIEYTFGAFHIVPSLPAWDLQVIQAGGGRFVVTGKFRKNESGTWVAEVKYRLTGAP